MRIHRISVVAAAFAAVMLLLGALAPKVAHADPKKDIQQKMKEAMENYDLLEYEEARKLLNSALIFSPAGKVIERYHKIQLAERWPQAGDHLSVFKIDGVPCSVIICHDERYPELVRLPVLAGAQVVFYISHESGVREEHKIGPYRAQIQARAVENTVFVVHANAPANPDTSGSHGHSRIIAPDGNIAHEATVFGEDVMIETLDLKKASRANAVNSIKRGPLGDWWKDGVKRVRMIE